jgi:hypothetical protein
MLSLVLGTISLLLFFLPVLGVPIGGVAVLVGIVGTILAGFGRGGRLRYAVAGLLMSILALLVNVAIAYAPAAEVPSLRPLPSWQPIPDRPTVPPPAPPG